MAVSDIRFRRLGYIALNVSDLGKSRDFYESKLGLKADQPVAGGQLFLRCSDKHHDLMLIESHTPGVKRIGWQMESLRALAAVREHFTAIGLTTTAVPAAEAATLGIGEAFRASEPTTGVTFEFYFEMAAAPAPFVPTHTQFMNLGHIVLVSPDRPATERFMLEHLNFRVSDRIDNAVTFMRCFPNPYHHSFAINAGAKPGLHHVNFMVTELADVGRGNNRMKQAGVPIVYGIGKHPPSESIFLYFLDPDGMTMEYSFGMEEFPEEAPRGPRNMPANLESIDYWGGIPDPRACKTGELERLTQGP
jgi:2,3-dihydroxy-p-cumate/2,3-dihydroxybenzoate 3,4-dioxygenase